FTHTPTPAHYSLSLHDALPILYVEPVMSALPEYAPMGAAVLGGALVVGAAFQGRVRALLWLALLASVGVILWLTLVLVFGDGGGTGLNLRLFQEINRNLDNRDGSA